MSMDLTCVDLRLLSSSSARRIAVLLTGLALCVSYSIPDAAAAATADPEAGPNGATICGDHPCVSLWNGGLTFSPGIRIDADGGDYLDQRGDEPLRSGTNLRRERLLAHGTFARDFGYDVTYDFDGSPGDRNKLQEAQVDYAGLSGLTLRAGAFQLQHLVEYTMSSFQTPFIERASITNIAASVASGARRWAAGAEAHGARWSASLYGSAGTADISYDGRERGVVARATGLLIDTSDLQLQIGVNGAKQFHPGLSTQPGLASFSDFPELRLSTFMLLDTKSFNARSTYAYGPDAEALVGRLYLEGLYQSVGSQAGGGLPNHRFAGWYVTAAYPLLGTARGRDASSASWSRPQAGSDASRTFGAFELAARYSQTDLNDGKVQGGRQAIWTGALNWYPTASLRVTAEYQDGFSSSSLAHQHFQTLGGRLALSL